MLITDLLSNPQLREALGKQYKDGIASAVEGYEDSAADEDSLTGALGQALRGHGSVSFGDGRIVKWRTGYRKLRGRGKNAPEKKWGADGIFEVEITDDSGFRSRKTLPFQAKNNSSSYGNGELVEQAGKIAGLPGGGIVVNYRPGGYVAVDAKLVANRAAGVQQESSLAEKLSHEFLACKIGSAAYLFEAGMKGFVSVEGRVLRLHPWTPGHRVRTRLVVLRAKRAR